MGGGFGFQHLGFGVGIVGIHTEALGNLAAHFGFKAHGAGAAGIAGFGLAAGGDAVANVLFNDVECG